MWILWVLLLVLIFVLISAFYLRGEDLSRFDSPAGQVFPLRNDPDGERDAVVAALATGLTSIQQAPRSQRLALMREYVDNISAGLDLPATITAVDADGVPAEWVVAPGAVPSRRLLYIHGGAFTMGSPTSHRNITNRFSEITGAAVLAIDYRLMPEHPRMAGIEDCRRAYAWMLENGPDGPGTAECVYVAGDSAGGNLALSLIAWIRDRGLVQPTAAVALSPIVDMTFASPSFRRNMETDAMLGPMFKGMARVPTTLLLWFSWLQSRMSPRDPRISPVYGDLSGLPPVLVHASEAEILLDDARRYVNRAVAAGSPARLQVWPQMVHVWQMFYPQLSEARQSWEEIGKFIAEVETAAGRSAAGA
ncbi:MAG: alpha/beta hydrolase [Halioglobus sp.]|nr:alpha/beta hydrolase [Halioglobus sp.]